ncbi:MAG: histidine kinase [Propionibacteriaceae bacterium]|nr:sensor domain-containing protein [Micropruina sp.]HBX81533.1 histidine kinase [Propionibacteriaceae bacterium]HBY21752.1 histidine kinase [Propionibacteriaceae bacterium]
MSSGNVTTALARAPWRFLTSRWPWLSLIYLVISAALGIVLLPLLIFTFLILPLWALGIGGLERHRTRLLGFASQASGHIPVDELERHHWLGIRLTEAATWRETLALLVDLVLGLAALVILFFQGIGIAVLVGAAGAGLNGPTDIQVIGGVHAVMTPANWWLTLPIGLGWLCLLAYLNATLAAVQASALRLLCGPHPQELDEKLQRVLRSRRTLAEASEAERRRIERDLHDGVQQELIVLGARLGMINLELDEVAGRGIDLADAQRAVEAAQTQAERAMSTLRNTVRGIHPAVLTDLGLSAALEELAERHPTPVALTLEHNTRLPAVVETTAYYLACEALTNASKHATPTTIHLRTMLKDNTFSITVTDDGAGGAEEMAGVGLRGLRDRAEALNGHLQLTSPVGGPTELRLELPCAS